MRSAPDWLRGLDPPVPSGFVPWLVLFPEGNDEGGEEPVETGSRARLPDPELLMEAARMALGRALAPDGRERDGAFDLLAADAFVTWAAEAALDRPKPEAWLEEMRDRLAGGPSTG